MTSVKSTTDAKKGNQAVATSYYGLGGDSAIVQHVHLQWDATLAATITFESTEFDDVSLLSTVAGEWIQENPTSGVYIAISPGGAGSFVNMTITIPGGTAGGASVHIGNLGSLWLRAKVVATVAGFLRIRAGGKE